MNDSIKNGGPAFPSPKNSLDGAGSMGGMTLRDYFAARAMQAMVSSPDVLLDMASRGEESMSNIAATAAYQMADAMLRAREA